MSKKFLLFVFLPLLLSTTVALHLSRTASSPSSARLPHLPSPPSDADLYPGVSYIAVDDANFDVALINQQLSFPTHLTFTPDGQFLLVTQATGELLAFPKDTSGQLSSAPTLVTQLTPGPSGLTALALSPDFPTDRRLYLYTSAQAFLTTLSTSDHLLFGTHPRPTASAPPSPIPPALPTSLAARRPPAVDKTGQPVGLAVDPQSHFTYFLDYLEGRLYQIKPR